jgi:prephenate dehydrogenase
MSVQITIVGLGQIGASIGLALAAHKDQVTTVGHDKSPEIAQAARKMGAVDRIESNLPASVAGAGIILLALPCDQIHATLEAIAQDVSENAVLMDTSPVKVSVAAWVKELLPAQRHYVGLTPAINPQYVHGPGTGIDAAHADLFQHGLMGISAPPGTPGEAVQLAHDLATLLGSAPYYSDQTEIDGVMAAAHLLPHLAAVALANALVDQPGWPDIRKMAGRPFAASTALLLDGEIDGLGEAALGNGENVTRILDNLLFSLQDLRDHIANQNKKGLNSRINHARQGRLNWWAERSKGDWTAVEHGTVEMPDFGNVLQRQLGGMGKLFRRGGDKSGPGEK